MQAAEGGVDGGVGEPVGVVRRVVVDVEVGLGHVLVGTGGSFGAVVAGWVVDVVPIFEGVVEGEDVAIRHAAFFRQRVQGITDVGKAPVAFADFFVEGAQVRAQVGIYGGKGWVGQVGSKRAGDATGEGGALLAGVAGEARVEVGGVVVVGLHGQSAGGTVPVGLMPRARSAALRVKIS